MRHEIPVEDLPAGWTGPSLKQWLHATSFGVLEDQHGNRVAFFDADVTAEDLADELALYTRPARVLLLDILRAAPPADLRTVQWDSDAAVTTRLKVIATSAQGVGEHTLTKDYHLPSSLQQGAMGWEPKPGAVPVARTVQTYTENALGQAESRLDTHTLYNDDGSTHDTWTTGPKLYSLDEQASAGETRRSFTVKWLQGLVAAGVSDRATGQDLLLELQGPVNAFVVSGQGDVFVATLAAAVTALQADADADRKAAGDRMSAIMPIITARLSPWTTP